MRAEWRDSVVGAHTLLVVAALDNVGHGAGSLGACALVVRSAQPRQKLQRPRVRDNKPARLS